MLQLINLPEVVLETILSNLTYDEIARNRTVCKQFDQTCKKLLNRGFNLMEKYHAQCLRAVKSQLPRRESERRSHPLARHCDILTAIETRISMLSMTFIKYVDLNLCCFIPGKVIDEIFRVLRLIRDSKTPPRAHEILQELRDISSMAMEHFDEKILPKLRNSICTSVVSHVGAYDLPNASLMISHHTNSGNVTLAHSFSSEKLNQTFKKIHCRTRKNQVSVLSVREKINKLKLRLKRQGFHMKTQSLKIQEQGKQLHDQIVQMAEMKKHVEEWEQKVGDLKAELSRSREENAKPDAIAKPRKLPRIDMDLFKSVDSDKGQGIDLQAKKRKLIIERKIPSSAKDVQFKKFLSDLLSSGRSGEDTPSSSD